MNIEKERRLRKVAEERLANALAKNEVTLANALVEKEATFANALADKEATISEQENTIAELMKRLAIYENTQSTKRLQ